MTDEGLAMNRDWADGTLCLKEGETRETTGTVGASRERVST